MKNTRNLLPAFIVLIVLPTIDTLLDDLRNWSRKVIAKAQGTQTTQPAEPVRRLSI